MEFFFKRLNDKWYSWSIHKIDKSDEKNQTCDKPAIMSSRFSFHNIYGLKRLNSSQKASWPL